MWELHSHAGTKYRVQVWGRPLHIGLSPCVSVSSVPLSFCATVRGYSRPQMCLGEDMMGPL